MQFTGHLVALLALLPLTLSSSFAGSSHKTATATPFLLRAKVISNSSTSNYDGLYVYPHHTGAAQNAAALQEYRDDITWARLNKSQVVFDLLGASGASYSLRFFKFDLSEGWGYMTISAAGVGHDGEFNVDSHGHLTFPSADALKQKGFSPWRVCLWNHGVPELFFNNVESDDKSATFIVPSTCELVQLELRYSIPNDQML